VVLTVPMPRLFPAVLAVATVLSPPLGANEGITVFENHCASCHGKDGKARTLAGRMVGARDLSESKIADDEIVRQILEGVKDPKGKSRMPAFKEKLTTAEVTLLVTHVKNFRR
jgi:mono/diheme cytochrome c family protein